MRQTSPYPIRDNGLIRFGKLMRQHWNGHNETLREDVSEPDALRYLDGPTAKHSTAQGVPDDRYTFDHFVPERWACPR